jgi:hypothetical protein
MEVRPGDTNPPVRIIFRAPTHGGASAPELPGLADARSRVATLRSAFALVLRLDHELAGLPRIEAELVDFDRILAGGLQRPALTQLNARLDAAEDLLMAVSSQVPFALMRSRLRGLEHTDAELLAFLRLLERLCGTPEYCDRFELFMTLLFRARPPALGVRPFAEVGELLDQFLSPVRCNEKTRHEAIAFFRDAQHRVGELASIDAIFDSGFYTDIEGYKIALRDDYFDPEVLHAAAGLNIALGAALKGLLGDDASQEKLLAARFEEARAKVRAVFREELASFQRGLTTRTRQQRPSIDPATILRKEPAAARAQPSRSLRRAIATLLIVAGLFAGADLLRRNWRVSDRNMSPVAAASLAQLHPALMSGSYGGESHARVFTGKVDPDRWKSMSHTERRELLLRLWGNFDADVRSALIYRDDVLAGHIVDGNVRFQE